MVMASPTQISKVMVQVKLPDSDATHPEKPAK